MRSLTAGKHCGVGVRDERSCTNGSAVEDARYLARWRYRTDLYSLCRLGTPCESEGERGKSILRNDIDEDALLVGLHEGLSVDPMTLNPAFSQRTVCLT